jgi:2-dehydro-3-deoxygluconokinase
MMRQWGSKVMLKFANKNVVTIGEAMVEMAPTQSGLYQRGFAGDTFNTAWHLAQTLRGQGKVGFVTRVGTDAISDAFLQELHAGGLQTFGIGRDETRSMGLYMIELDGVERRFHYWRSVSAARQLAADLGALTAALAGAGLIHVSGITLAILPPEGRETLFCALARARSAGATVSFDPNIRPKLWNSLQDARQTVARALELTDIALPSFDDEKMLWGDDSPQATIARMKKAGAREIAVKDGAGPITFWAGEEVSFVLTPSVPEICDTTGAGDAFNAGYLAARILGHPPAKAVVAGQRLSGAIIQHYGARLPKSAIPAIG